MDGWRIVNDLSSKAISCSNGFFHACLYITWVLYNSPHCKFPINFGFWLHAGFNVTLLIMTKVSFQTHDKQNIRSYNCILWPCPWKNKSKFWHYFGKKKNSSQKTHTQTNLQKLADLNSIKVHSQVSSKVPSHGGGCCTSNPNRSRSSTRGEL